LAGAAGDGLGRHAGFVYGDVFAGAAPIKAQRFFLKKEAKTFFSFHPIRARVAKLPRPKNDCAIFGKDGSAFMGGAEAVEIDFP
jgi:hypothetical protein